MAIHAACFDLDGTLIDSTEAIVACFYYTFDTLGQPRPSREAITTTIGHILRDQMATMTDHDPDECVRIYRKRYAEICFDQTFLMEGGKEALERLRVAGFRLGFATSKLRAFAEPILEHLGVLDYFEVRLGPEDVERPKPEPDPFLKAAAGLGVKPCEMAVVGDTFFDVEAARRAGSPCYCVTTGYETREQLEARNPAGVFDSLQELVDQLLADAC